MSSSKQNDSNVEMENELKAEIAQLEKLLGGEDPERIVQKHIKLLHDYNESKDAAQALMGKLALIRGTTVRQLHELHGLSRHD